MAKPQYRWPPGLREAVLKRDDYKCKIRLTGICTVDATDVDHIVPHSQGGAWFDPDNLRAACKPCNSALGNPKAHWHRSAAAVPSRAW